MKSRKILFAGALCSAVAITALPAQAEHRDEYRYQPRAHHQQGQQHHRADEKHKKQGWGHHASKHARQHHQYDGKIRNVNYREHRGSIELFDQRHRLIRRISLHHADHWNVRKGRLVVHYPNRVKVYGGRDFRLLSSKRKYDRRHNDHHLASSAGFWLRFWE